LIFDRVDYNKNGVIEDAEVELAVMKVYHQVNRRLPGIQDPPSREKIRQSLAVFDSNRNGVLERKEFVNFIGNVVSLGPNAFLKNVLVNTAVLPTAAGALKGLDKHAPALLAAIGPVAKLAGLDDKYLAPLLGVAYKTVRGLIPV
jgi:Ca2+-binding EF-hand superfamily protein